MVTFQTQQSRVNGENWDKPKLLERQLLTKIISALCSGTCGVAGDEKPEGCSAHTYVFAPSSCPSPALKTAVCLPDNCMFEHC